MKGSIVSKISVTIYINANLGSDPDLLCPFAVETFEKEYPYELALSPAELQDDYKDFTQACLASVLEANDNIPSSCFHAGGTVTEYLYAHK